MKLCETSSPLSDNFDAIYFRRYLRYAVPVAHPRYKREFDDQTVAGSQGDNFSRSLVAVYAQGLGTSKGARVNYVIKPE